MPPRLLFRDEPTAVDALTFAQRAARLDDGVVQLRAADGVLTIAASALAPRGLLDATPTVIGMRVMAVDPELVCDLSVDAGSLLRDGTALLLPDTAVRAAWAGVSPPRTDWHTVGDISAAALTVTAEEGVAAVAARVPTEAGEDLVRTVRTAVWGEADPALNGLPRAVAFAALALGFLSGDETVPVRVSGPWSRVTLRRGHVLVRRQQLPGLTPVRRTGR